ncbi:MAG TPA: hypothetical protein VIK61_13110 [Acidimicrobiia bacterium]
MTTPRSLAALMAMLVLVGACGRSVPRAESVAGASASTHGSPIAGSDARSGDAVPFVAESPAPATPPDVRLLVTSHSDTAFLLAHRYTSDWPDGHRADEQRPREPVPWPTWEPAIDVIFAKASALVLALGTPIAPDSVTIRAYARVVPASGTPIGDPLATFECHRFTGPKCAFTKTNSVLGVEVRGVDLGMLAGSYITAFASWHVPAALQDRASSPAEASASWLFRGRAEAQIGASRP